MLDDGIEVVVLAAGRVEEVPPSVQLQSSKGRDMEAQVQA
jgi:hypothetical protein